jgi:hypothetical protein
MHNYFPKLHDDTRDLLIKDLNRMVETGKYQFDTSTPLLTAIRDALVLDNGQALSLFLHEIKPAVLKLRESNRKAK